MIIENWVPTRTLTIFQNILTPWIFHYHFYLTPYCLQEIFVPSPEDELF